METRGRERERGIEETPAVTRERERVRVRE